MIHMEERHWKIVLEILSKYPYAFEESDLPFKVDVINWNSMDPNFQALIQKDLVFVRPDLRAMDIKP